MRDHHCLAIFVLACYAQATAQPVDAPTTQLTVHVQGIRASQGFISVAVYCSEPDWLKSGAWVAGAQVPAGAGSRVVVKGVPLARCAVSIFHDINGNNELDRKLLPTEPYGFSRNPAVVFGPPSFRDCAIQVHADQEVWVSLR
jgi:uncharacterized protein (DUF2141 family)